MDGVSVTRHDFLQDRQGNAFADFVNDPQTPFDTVLDFFGSEDRQRRMIESEIRDDRAPLAAVERELESQPSIRDFVSSKGPNSRKRLGQVVTVVVRMTMDRLGWENVSETVGMR